MPVLGLTTVLTSLDSVQASMLKQVGDAVQNAGIVTEAVAKQRTRVRTGRLRAGNRYVKTGERSCRIGNAVRYAAAVELGHRVRGKSGRTVPPRPFLFPGYLAGKQALKEDLAKIPGLRIRSWS
ncbi:MAG TPA: HK97 gp10 family phage protein [Ktedonobacteraceae bacterium]|nr:HK97 gp10 family phage protein [Ktedonobacteraceae bacterium]